MRHFIAIAISAFIAFSSFSQDKPTQRAEYRKFIQLHPFYNRAKLTSEKLDQMPNYDRPDLAWEQNFLMTLDPALGYPPVERLKPIKEYVKAFNNILMPSVPGDGAGGANWTERGPDNVGGRTRAIMFDPNDVTNKKVWAGSVGGGLWVNNDITSVGSGWTKVNDFWDNIAITSIAYDPNNTNTFYVGTGEGWFNLDAIRGGGIWKSTDGGINWSLLASTDPSAVDFDYIQKILIHPVTSDIYAATRSRFSNRGGLMRSQDGGASWTQVLGAGSGAAVDWAADIEIGADNTIYVSMGIFQTDGVYNSSTGNMGSWTKLNTGANGFPISGFERIELATAPSDANVLYAVTQHASTNKAQGVYLSSDKGANWRTMTTPITLSAGGGSLDTFTRNQAWYDLIIKVDPSDADIVYIGGIDILKSLDSGSSWLQRSFWHSSFGTPVVHADQHAIEFQPGSSSTIIFGNDGGIFYSDDGGTTFDDRIKDYNVTQFYSCAIHPIAGTNYFLAGSQDNGTHQFSTSGINSTLEVTGGDGGFCFIDQTDPTYQISFYTDNQNFLSTDGGTSFSTLNTDDLTGKFINPADYDDIQDVLYSGRDVNSLARILDISGTPVIDDITILGMTDEASHIRVSPYTTASTTLFVGTEAGTIFKVTTANTFQFTTDIDPSATLPSGYITCIEIGASENELLVTFSNYGVASVWYTSDGGTNWINKEGNLPDMPVRWAMFNPADRNEVILATEVGVWKTTDISVVSPSWVPSNSGLANVRVDMLQMRDADSAVIAATHGRGLFSSTFGVSGGCSVPVTPAMISGLDTVIELTMGVAYSCNAVPGATKYNWTIPTGSSIASGDTTNSITVDFDTTSGNICVNAENACGTSSNFCKPIVLNDAGSAPAMPDTVIGPDSVCAGTTSISYATNSVLGATTYNWTVPVGAFITAGNGTTTITVDFGNNEGTVCVNAENSFGTSADRCIAIAIDSTIITPDDPGSISSVDTICLGEDNVSFSIAPVTGASSYIWTVPILANIISGQGTTDIIVDFGSVSGAVCVKAQSGCGTSATECKTLAMLPYNTPAAPGTIVGSTSVCTNAQGIYSVNTVTGATSYNWTVPADATIISGQGTNMATVKFGTDSGSVCVRSENFCDVSNYKCSSINVSPCAGVESVNIKNSLSLQPNPHNGMMILSFAVPNSEEVKINILNTTGQLVYREVIKDNKSSLYSKFLDFSSWTKGIYFVEIENNDTIIREKVIYQ